VLSERGGRSSGHQTEKQCARKNGGSKTRNQSARRRAAWHHEDYKKTKD
jgi:hypothetical protein